MSFALRHFGWSITLVTLAACGVRDPSAAEGFSVRTSELFSGEPEVGGLTVHVDNLLPQVDVPKPHTPTVFHLNVSLCSALPKTLPAAETQAEPEARDEAEGDTPPPQEAPAADANDRLRTMGERRCLDLSPTLFAGQSGSYVVTAHEVDALINKEHTHLVLEFVTSAQMSRHAMRCAQAGVGRVVPDRSISNALSVSVVGQRLTSFNCR